MSAASEKLPTHHRTIRSYVLRQGRITPAQQRAIDTLSPHFCLPFADSPPDYDALFGKTAPLILEIGFGMGETTAKIAASRPDLHFLAIEVHGPGVGSLLQEIKRLELNNLRLIQHDAVEVIDTMIADDSLSGIHVFFPDPWPKKKHHKRRLLQPAFVHQLARRLTNDGYLHIATDWREYAEAILETLNAESLLRNTAEHFAPRPETRPRTKFEARGLRFGHEVFDLLFRKP
ncbi:MAG: tRNA (guanosine(46)-N7)-methyltransferase TrmB [Burkholderiales bacterium]|jgi:tRNA (guanine-N7-)-methyltransferase|nr:tRNA (guanosine(46)-N7)-methyltransferase TrmB [Burkholderiales bacterium]